MFTKEEMNVLQAALRHWDGPYKQGAELTARETIYVKDQLKLAASLAQRFEDILYYYYQLENGQLP